MAIKRGDIVWVNLDPTIGDEVAKTRPCLILQNNLGNRHSRKTIIASFLKPKAIVLNVKFDLSF